MPVFGVPHRVRRELDPKAPPVRIADGEIRVRGDPIHLPRRVRDHLTALAQARLRHPRPRHRRTHRQERDAGRGARSEKPLGKLLVEGRAVVQLAPRLRCRRR